MDSSLTIGSHAIRRDGDMWCLTDLWRAAGAPRGNRPSNWLRKEGASFVEFLRDSSSVPDGHTRKKPGDPARGEPPTTWAHWQLALAYAKALSPQFHARVNEVYRAFTAGQLVPKESATADELIRLTLRINRLDAKDYESVWDRELKIEIARLYGVTGWTPGPGNGSEPMQMQSAYGWVWRWILGEETYRELKRRNPHPRDGSLHGQWLQDQRLRLIKREDLVLTLYIARRSSRWADFAHEMRAHFRRAGIQLRLVK